MPDLVKARWLPLYTVTLPNGRQIHPGDVVQIGEGEATASEHWEIVPAKASKPTSASETQE